MPWEIDERKRRPYFPSDWWLARHTCRVTPKLLDTLDFPGFAGLRVSQVYAARRSQLNLILGRLMH
ncbi:hypothetical protein NUBL21974_51150 [Klebsiella quasipneumoniae]|nr:hypothetical protein NUBL21974_51150 [Klebsiella quasipneumoniae]